MKKYLSVIPMVLLLCFVVGCQDKAAMAELEEFKAQAAVEEENKATVTRLIEGLNEGNIEIANELYASEYGFYSPSINPEPMNREETLEFLRVVFQAFPDINWKIEKVFAEEDRVLVWNVVTGTHEGEFQGIPATGNNIEVSSILVLRLQEGKITEEREEADLLGLMMQLGMELKPVEKE